jgi:hypothetical protein
MMRRVKLLFCLLLLIIAFPFLFIAILLSGIIAFILGGIDAIFGTNSYSLFHKELKKIVERIPHES